MITSCGTGRHTIQRGGVIPILYISILYISILYITIHYITILYIPIIYRWGCEPRIRRYLQCSCPGRKAPRSAGKRDCPGGNGDYG